MWYATSLIPPGAAAALNHHWLFTRDTFSGLPSAFTVDSSLKPTKARKGSVSCKVCLESLGSPSPEQPLAYSRDHPLYAFLSQILCPATNNRTRNCWTSCHNIIICFGSLLGSASLSKTKATLSKTTQSPRLPESNKSRFCASLVVFLFWLVHCYFPPTSTSTTSARSTEQDPLALGLYRQGYG